MKKNFFYGIAVMAVLSSCGTSYKAKDVTLNSREDSISYFFGLNMGADLKTRQFPADKADQMVKFFIERFDKEYKKQSGREVSDYYSMGERVADIVHVQEMEGLVGDSTIEFKTNVFSQGFINMLNGADEVFDSQTAYKYFNEGMGALRQARTQDGQEGVKATSELSKFAYEVNDIELTSNIDSLNYAFGSMQGAQISEMLKRDTIGDAYDQFISGLKSGMKAKVLEDKQERELAGLIKYRLVPEWIQLETVGPFGDSLFVIDHSFAFQGLVNGLYTSADSLPAVSQQCLAYLDSIVPIVQRENLFKKYADNKEAGEKFLADNANNDSVVVLESGLQYKVLQAGTGALPTDTSRVSVQYEGRLIDGTVFDSSYRRNEPFQFSLRGGVIEGWLEAVKLMPVGSKWQVYIPYELGYGERGNGTIKPFSTLVFDIELLEILK